MKKLLIIILLVFTLTSCKEIDEVEEYNLPLYYALDYWGNRDFLLLDITQSIFYFDSGEKVAYIDGDYVGIHYTIRFLTELNDPREVIMTVTVWYLEKLPIELNDIRLVANYEVKIV